MRTKSGFVYLLPLMALILFSCKDRKEIKSTVQMVYSMDSEFSEMTRLSEELKGLLDSAGYSGNLKAVKNKSDSYNYKVEGRLLVGSNKEFTSFHIEKIGIERNRANATVSLKNDNIKKVWIDTVKLIYHKKWKVDDIVYDKYSHPELPTLKENLQKSKREIYG